MLKLAALTLLLLAIASLALAQPATPAKPQAKALTPEFHEGTEARHNHFNEISKEGKAKLVFLGDSITQGWEGNGKNVWAKFYGGRKSLNFGVGGDRTEHVLWRFEQGQLNGIKPKAAVLMIGTNNSNKNKDGTEAYSEAEILEGVKAIVQQLRERTPETKVLVLGIFPRGATFSTQRGKLLQINQALAKLADGKMIHYLDFGSQLIEADGSISKTLMPDYLHLSEAGYEIWANAIEAKLKELLGEK